MQNSDPLDHLIARGVRVVWMEQFDDEVVLVDDSIALVDTNVSRLEAARSLRCLLGISCACFESSEIA